MATNWQSIPVSGADPAAAAGVVQVYAKDVAGVIQYFARASDGTITQLTPGSSGVYTPPEQWAQNGIAISQTDVDLSAQVSTSFDTWQAIRAGSIRGLRTRMTETITAGTLDVTVTINGAEVTLTVAHTNASNQNGGVATQAAGVDTYVAGDLIGISLTTNGTFAPVTADVEAYLDISDT